MLFGPVVFFHLEMDQFEVDGGQPLICEDLLANRPTLLLDGVRVGPTNQLEVDIWPQTLVFDASTISEGVEFDEQFAAERGKGMVEGGMFLERDFIGCGGGNGSFIDIDAISEEFGVTNQAVCWRAGDIKKEARTVLSQPGWMDRPKHFIGDIVTTYLAPTVVEELNGIFNAHLDKYNIVKHDLGNPRASDQVGDEMKDAIVQRLHHDGPFQLFNLKVERRELRISSVEPTECRAFQTECLSSCECFMINLDAPNEPDEITMELVQNIRARNNVVACSNVDAQPALQVNCNLYHWEEVRSCPYCHCPNRDVGCSPRRALNIASSVSPARDCAPVRVKAQKKILDDWHGSEGETSADECESQEDASFDDELCNAECAIRVAAECEGGCCHKKGGPHDAHDSGHGVVAEGSHLDSEGAKP